MAQNLPVRFLNYPGDARGILDEGAKGPSTMNELLYPVTAEYDEKADTTRVGFSYIAPATGLGLMPADPNERRTR